MKTKRIFFTLAILPACLLAYGQSTFSADAYVQFLKQSRDMTYQEIQGVHNPPQLYYSGRAVDSDPCNWLYFDTIAEKLELTKGEIDLIKQNHFMVSERLEYYSIEQVLQEMFRQDLPLFFTTDLVLQALHMSYDQVLMDVEIWIMEPNLIEAIDQMYGAFPALVDKYGDNPVLLNSLKDVDLYVTMVHSLIRGSVSAPQLMDEAVFTTYWDAVQAEDEKDIGLFCERLRHIDFSQFTPRGHYTLEYVWWPESGKTLENYFKTMMWLGRIDFFMTPPPKNPWEPDWTKEEIRRMNISAFMLQELLHTGNITNLLNENDRIITFFVGESDNLTPEEYDNIILESSVETAEDLLNDAVYDPYYENIEASQDAGQRIMSSFLLVDPFSEEPGKLPASYRVMGQKFVIDSYVFANVVFDRVVYQGEKIWRPLPVPLDAMFVLGNDDALPLLEDELEEYKYASQLEALRYLVDAYDDEFWGESLYNTWLNGIRELNPPYAGDNLPWFMSTTAWHQEKLNTQLASWAQLRHDNLLYAKQSYTGGVGCSYPHVLVEPYPEFYGAIGEFATMANDYFKDIEGDDYIFFMIRKYFASLENIMTRLEEIASYEVQQIPLTDDQKTWLQEMLTGGMASGPPIEGWLADLFYDVEKTREGDFIVADVHTQPTDEEGAYVGRILHVGVGKLNLGVFLGNSPFDQYKPVAFVGPVMSYYEKITENFDRLTDERWKEYVWNDELPDRPDWTNSYLADKLGNSKVEGRELPGQLFMGSGVRDVKDNQTIFSLEIYPNPVGENSMIHFILKQAVPVTMQIYDATGRKVNEILNEHRMAGDHWIEWSPGSLKKGIYFGVLRAGLSRSVIKILVQ
jgi:hypothetical protein